MRDPTLSSGSAPGRRDQTGATLSSDVGAAMSPGMVLAVLGVLIAAQVTRLVAPSRGSYPLALGCAAVGLLLGELIALSGHGGPVLGAIHPLPDLAAMAALEVAGNLLLPPRRAARR